MGIGRHGVGQSKSFIEKFITQIAEHILLASLFCYRKQVAPA